MDDWRAKLSQLGLEHIIFQQALWIALDGREIGLETVEGPLGIREVKADPKRRVEIVSKMDGSIVVRRARD